MDNIIGDVNIHYASCKTCVHDIGNGCVEILKYSSVPFQLMLTKLNGLSVVCMAYKEKES